MLKEAQHKGKEGGKKEGEEGRKRQKCEFIPVSTFFLGKRQIQNSMLNSNLSQIIF